MRRATAEGLGTALLLCAVVGSGIMGERLSGGNVGQALLANSLATGCALFVVVLTLSPAPVFSARATGRSSPRRG